MALRTRLGRVALLPRPRGSARIGAERSTDGGPADGDGSDTSVIDARAGAAPSELAWHRRRRRSRPPAPGGEARRAAQTRTTSDSHARGIENDGGSGASSSATVGRAGRRSAAVTVASVAVTSTGVACGTGRTSAGELLVGSQASPAPRRGCRSRTRAGSTVRPSRSCPVEARHRRHLPAVTSAPGAVPGRRFGSRRRRATLRLRQVVSDALARRRQATAGTRSGSRGPWSRTSSASDESAPLRLPDEDVLGSTASADGRAQ